MQITPYDLAQRYIGIREISEAGKDHPLIQWWLSLCGFGLDAADEIPWCSAFVNGIAWELRLPRSKSAMARSWLGVGTPTLLLEARPGFDIVILRRGDGEQPGPEVLNAPGHVGFYAGYSNGSILLLGGNQQNGINIAPFREKLLLGIRRLAQV